MRCILINMIPATGVPAMSKTENNPPPPVGPSLGPPRRLSSAALLQGERQIVIDHAGREYRLRVTAQGKLILTA
jgi:hemin uptake protein HemP